MAFIGNSMRTTPNGFGGNGQSPLAPPRANVRQWTPEQLRERISSLPAPQFRQQTSWQSPISGRSGSGYVLPSSATTGPFASPFAQASHAKQTGVNFQPSRIGAPLQASPNNPGLRAEQDPQWVAAQQAQRVKQANLHNQRAQQVHQLREQTGANQGNPTAEQSQALMLGLYGQEYQPFLDSQYAAENPIARQAAMAGVSTQGIAPGESSAFNVPGLQPFYNQMFGGVPRPGTAAGQAYRQSQFGNNLPAVFAAAGGSGTGLLNQRLW